MTERERIARIIAESWYIDFDWSLLEYGSPGAYADAYWKEFVETADKILEVVEERRLIPHLGTVA